MPRNRLLIVKSVTLLAFAFALAACSGSSTGRNSHGSGDPSLAAPNLGGGPIDPFLTDGQAVLRAFDAIAARSAVRCV